MMWRHFATHNRQFALAGIIGALTTMCNIALLCTSAFLIARAAQMPPVLELTVAVVSVRALALSRSAGRYTERLMAHDATFRSLSSLRAAIYRSIEGAAPLGQAAQRRGDTLSRAVGDVERLQDLPLRVVLPVAGSALSAVAVAITACALLPTAGVVVASALLIAATAAPRAALAVAAASEASVASTAGQVTDELLELLEGQADLAMLGASETAVAAVASSDRRLRDASRRLAWGTGAAAAIVGLCQAAALAGSVWAAGRAVADGTLSAVMSVVVGLLPLAAFETVAGLPAAALAWVAVRSSGSRVDELLGMAEPAACELTASFPAVLAGDLILTDVAAGWDGTTAIQGVSLTVRSGRVTALLGTSGGGKSTVLAVLAGLLRPMAGSYRIGDVDTAAIPSAAVREHVVLSLQDSHIFTTTVAENLRLAARPGAPRDDRALEAALESVGLGPWLAGLPRGLDTVIGENGATMSGGQRQRLLAARMLVADPDVWLLDEPTEHLDRASAREVLAAIVSAARGRTIVIASHLLDDAELADDIVHVGAQR